MRTLATLIWTAFLFAVLVTPIGIILRLFGYDKLGLRKGSDKETYWIPCPSARRTPFHGLK